MPSLWLIHWRYRDRTELRTGWPAIRLNCNEKHRCDHRNRGRQSYCSKPACRKASKAASQRRWLSRPENENYFRGAGEFDTRLACFAACYS